MPKRYQPPGVGMTPSKTKLGKFLRARRLKLGLRQTEAAKISGMRQSHYSAFETGLFKSLKPKQLSSLSKALQCEPLQLQSLFFNKPEPKTELGKLIRTRRKRLGLTLKEFAKFSGINYPVIRILENGIRDSFSYRLIKPLAKALALEPSVLSKYVGRKMKATDSKLGQLIRTRRKELAFNQIQLAEKLQITRQFLSQIELGKCPLSQNDIMIELLAKVLELDILELQKARPAIKVRRRSVEEARLTPLGKFLTRRRLELGLSQKELAGRMEIWMSTISVIETGRLHPGPKLLNKLSRALECQIPAELIPLRITIRLSNQGFKNLSKIKEISNINNDSEIIDRAIELLREQLEKPT